MLRTARTRILVASLAAAALAAYAPALGNGFAFDDVEYLVRNPHLARGFLHALRWAWTGIHAANWHPLTWISHALDLVLFGLHPAGHHLVNVLLHVANTLLLYQVLRSMTGADGRSALVAALFALHPLHVESVAWISERKDVLSTFFLLLTLLAHLRHARRPSAGRYLLTALLFALGLLAKSMLVTLPFVLLLLDGWPLGRSGPGGGAGRVALRTILLEKVPLLALSACSGAVTLHAQQSWGAVVPVAFTLKLANIPVAYCRYLGKMLWPADLAGIYPFPVGGYPFWQPVVATLVLAALTAVALVALRRRPWLALGWAWYLGTLVPVIGFVQVGQQSLADRYTYIPLIGPFIAIAWECAAAHARFPGVRRPLAAAAAALPLVLGTLTVRQIGYWHDDVALHTHALAVTADNALAHLGIAVELIRRDREEEAIPHLREALRINPRDPIAQTYAAGILTKRGRHAEALPIYAKALEMYPRYAPARAGIAISLTALGRHDEAVREYREAVALRPLDETSRVNLANLLDNLGRVDEAVTQYRETLRINPENDLALYNLGIALLKQGRRDEAAAELRKAVMIRPENLSARRALADLSRQAAQ